MITNYLGTYLVKVPTNHRVKVITNNEFSKCDKRLFSKLFRKMGIWVESKGEGFPMISPVRLLLPIDSRY